MRQLSLLTFLVLTAPSSLTAEVYNCDGRWTNLPCTGTVIQTLDQNSGATRVLKPEVARAQSAKRSILHELTMGALGARRDLGVHVDISRAEEICSQESSSIVECEDTVAELQRALAEGIKDAELIAARREEALQQKRANDLAEERNALIAQQNLIEALDRDDGVTIIEQNNFGTEGSVQIIEDGYRRSRRRSPPYPGRYPNSPTGRIFSRESPNRW